MPRQRRMFKGDGRCANWSGWRPPRSRLLGAGAADGAGNAAQGRHDPHDGALCRELRQPRPAHHAARAGRDRRQGAATHALQLGLGQRTSWCWSSPTSVTASADGLVYTYKLRDDAYFHNGRKMTADDIIWSFTRIMDGSKGYPGARYVRLIKGAIDVEKGAGQGDLRPEEDRRLHARDDDHRPRRSGLLLLRRHDRDPAQGRGREGQLRRQSGRPRARSSSRSTSPARASSLERFDKFYKPGKPYADRIVVADHGRGRRRATSPSATRRSTPRSWARRSTSPIAPIRSSPRASSRSPRCSRARCA